MRAVLSFLLLTIALCTGAANGVEGSWRMTSGSAEFKIVPSGSTPGSYDIVLLYSHDMSAPTGAIIGEMRTTATPGRYVASFASNPARPGSKRRNLVATLNYNGSLSFEPFRKGKRVSLWRWIPYLFRVTVIQESKQPADIEGAVRLGNDDLTRHRIL